MRQTSGQIQPPNEILKECLGKTFRKKNELKRARMSEDDVR